MRMIFAAIDESEAAFVISLLESEGIPAQLWSVRGEGGQTPPQIWLLNDGDFDAASKVVQDYVERLEAPPAGGESWTCAGCGEEHEPSFSECWKCGRSRPT
ncbi:MAG TPA: DUF2007 domain-containing protein [Nitrospiria bacterium]